MYSSPGTILTLTNLSNEGFVSFSRWFEYLAPVQRLILFALCIVSCLIGSVTSVFLILLPVPVAPSGVLLSIVSGEPLSDPPLWLALIFLRVTCLIYL